MKRTEVPQSIFDGDFLICIIAAMRSMIKVNYLFGSTDITNFGLLGRVVKVAATTSHGLFIIYNQLTAC